MRLIAWEKIKAVEFKKTTGNIWELYASSPMDLKLIDFDNLEEMFAQPEKKAPEKKEETKKKGPTLIQLLDPKTSLGVNLITKNLRMLVDFMYNLHVCYGFI